MHDKKKKEEKLSLKNLMMEQLILHKLFFVGFFFWGFFFRFESNITKSQFTNKKGEEKTNVVDITHLSRRVMEEQQAQRLKGPVHWVVQENYFKFYEIAVSIEKIFIDHRLSTS